MESNSIFGLGLKLLQFEKIVPKLNPKDLKIERTKLKFVPKKPPQKKNVRIKTKGCLYKTIAQH
jgi:hypothetical protein